MGAAIEITTAGVASSIVCATTSAEPLLSVLISFGISVITIVGGECIKLATAWLKSKQRKLNGEIKENGDENGTT